MLYPNNNRWELLPKWGKPDVRIICSMYWLPEKGSLCSRCDTTMVFHGFKIWNTPSHFLLWGNVLMDYPKVFPVAWEKNMGRGRINPHLPCSSVPRILVPSTEFPTDIWRQDL